MQSLSFTLPLRSPYFIYTGSARLVSVCCNFICRLLLRTRPASRLHHPHATPLHLHNHDFLPPFYTHLLYMIRVDSDKCICVNVCGLLCILGLLFWRAGLRITLPLSVTSTSWLDTRTAISSTSFSHSGTLHLEPLQERHRCWTTTAELMSRLCLSAKSHCSLMPYIHPPTARNPWTSSHFRHSKSNIMQFYNSQTDFYKSSKPLPELQAVVLIFFNPIKFVIILNI